MATTTGYIDYTQQGSTPSTPSASHDRLYFRTSDGKACYLDSSGTVHVLAEGTALTNPMTTTGDMIYSSDNSGTAARLAIVAAGQVMKSGATPGWGYPTLHGAKVYNSTTQAVNNTNAALTFDSEEWDTDAFHSTVTNTSRITIPSGFNGYYLLQGGSFGSATWSWIGFQKNGAALRGYGGGVSAASHYMTTNAIVSLVATDYVELWVNTNTTCNMGHATLLDAQSWFSATLLGV